MIYWIAFYRLLSAIFRASTIRIKGQISERLKRYFLFLKSRITTAQLHYLQKARLARIRIVKNASGQALFSKKKAHESRMHAFEQGLLSLDALKDEDVSEYLWKKIELAGN